MTRMSFQVRTTMDGRYGRRVKFIERKYMNERISYTRTTEESISGPVLFF